MKERQDVECVAAEDRARDEEAAKMGERQEEDVVHHGRDYERRDDLPVGSSAVLSVGSSAVLPVGSSAVLSVVLR